MTAAFIEHINLSVSDVDQTARMLGDVFGWRIRWDGEAASGGHTIHVGSDTHYIAIYADSWTPAAPRSHSKGAPLNHVGVQVDDLDATEAKVRKAGLTPFAHGNYAPGRRFYFLDRDGIEYEVVSYAA